MISVPASDVINNGRRAFFLLMGVVSTAFALVILVINLLLRKTVIQPLNRITKVASEVSLGNMEAEFEQVSNDEIGKLAAAFSRMKTSLVMTLDMLKENK